MLKYTIHCDVVSVESQHYLFHYFMFISNFATFNFPGINWPISLSKQVIITIMWIQYSKKYKHFLYNRNQPIQAIRAKDIRKRHDTQEGRKEGWKEGRKIQQGVGIEIWWREKKLLNLTIEQNHQTCSNFIPDMQILCSVNQLN